MDRHTADAEQAVHQRHRPPLGHSFARSKFGTLGLSSLQPPSNAKIPTQVKGSALSRLSAPLLVIRALLTGCRHGVIVFFRVCLFRVCIASSLIIYLDLGTSQVILLLMCWLLQLPNTTHLQSFVRKAFRTSDQRNLGDQ